MIANYLLDIVIFFTATVVAVLLFRAAGFGAVLTVGANLLLDIPYRTAILIGPALALSSTAFVLQLLAEQKMLHSEYGRASLSVLLLQDLAVVPLLALVPLVAAREFMIGVDITSALLEAAVILLLVVTFMLQPFAILWLLVVLVVVKFAILFPLAASFRLGTGVSAAVGLMLAQSGEFGLILLAFMHQVELIATGVFQQLLLVIVLSMLVTPMIASLAQRLAATSRDVKEASDATPDMAPIVVAGFGRVGRRIGQVLMMADTPYVAIDFSSSVVLRERAAGHRVFYGDVRRPEVLRAVGIADASVVIVTLDDFEAAEDVVAAVHQVDPDITILARGHDSLQCRTLHKLGASLVVSENLEASLELAREALIRSDSDADKVEKMILNFRDSHYATVEGRKPKRQDAGKQ